MLGKLKKQSNSIFSKLTIFYETLFKEVPDVEIQNLWKFDILGGAKYLTQILGGTINGEILKISFSLSVSP